MCSISRIACRPPRVRAHSAARDVPCSTIIVTMETLHIVNGESVAGTLRESSVAGRIIEWPDILCEGPVPSVEDDDAFARTRAEYLASAGYTDYANALERLQRFYNELPGYPAY